MIYKLKIQLFLELRSIGYDEYITHTSGSEPLGGCYANKNQNHTIDYRLCVAMGNTAIFYWYTTDDVNNYKCELRA